MIHSPFALRLIRSRSAQAGGLLVLLLGLFALAGPLFLNQSPNESDFVHGRGPFDLPAGPSAAHLLGTDTLYRDVAARLAHGARLSLGLGLSATVLACGIGAALGLVAGYAHRSRFGWLDTALMRLVDAGLSFPYLLLVMAVGAMLDRTDLWSMALVLGATGWLGTCRLIRAKTIQLRQLDYVLAAQALGQSPLRVLSHHVLPNVTGPLIVIASASVASMILAESVLSYLAVGVQPPTATWGRMLREGQGFLLADPRLVAAPGLAILLAVLAFNLLGEGLRDALDPHS